MPELSESTGSSKTSTRNPAYSSGPIVLVLAIVVTISALRKTDPPPVLGAGAPAAEFSAARAMSALRQIAQRPHPLASADEAQVRGYVVRRLSELGAKPEIEAATVASTDRSGLRTFATVNDIIARIPGTAGTGAVMLSAHYDSVPSGPGAGDDSAAVAALIETVRALKSGSPLRNDVIVLFSDGEELGMLGAKAFVENYPALRSVKVALNFEMRGDYGPVVMFQTSTDNAWLIRALAATPFPRASSLAPALYKRLPNDTDLTLFMRAGIAGMNFSANGGLPRYHTRLDDIAHLDPRSMQHQGSYALALARRFGEADLSKPHTGDDIYFSAFGNFFHYRAGLAMPCAILAALLVLAALLAVVQRGISSASGIFAGLGIYAAAIVIAIAESRAVLTIFEHFAAREMLPCGTTYGGAFFLAASVAVIVASLCAGYSLLARSLGRANLGGGALAIWALLTLVCADALPAGSYLLTWPLIFAALAFNLRWSARGARDPIAPTSATLIAVIPCTVILSPLFLVAADATAMMFAFSAVLSVLMFGVFAPYTDLLTSDHERMLAGALFIATLAMFVIGLRQGQFSATQPRPDSIFYMLDASNGSAIWASVDRAPDRWTAQFFQHHVRSGALAILTGETASSNKIVGDIPRIFPHRSGRFCTLNEGATIEGDAPAAELAAPELDVIDDSSSAGVRTVTMHVVSARHAPIVWFTVARGVTILDSSIDGKSPGGGPSDGYSGWFWGAPDGGFDLTIKLVKAGPIMVNVLDQSDWLPSFPEMSITPRPSDVMPTPFLFFDSSTLVRKTFVIGGQTGTPNA
jgi:hypothetical protein